MRRLIAWELLSLDGVMETPEAWAFSYADDEMVEANASDMTASDALLMGRVTYEGMAAHWPHQPNDQPMVEHLNSVPKFVVSETLGEPLGWNNSTLIRGNITERIFALKRQQGRDITILGSGALVRSLLREGLLDELTLVVHPLILGGGKRLFEDDGDRRGLTLVDSRTFGTGVVTLVYRPDGEPAVIDHTGIGVADVGRSAAFYDAALGRIAVHPATTHFIPPGSGMLDRAGWLLPMIREFLDAPEAG